MQAARRDAGRDAVHAGSLDEPERFVPRAVTYGDRGLAWDPVDPSLQRYPTSPPR